MNEVAVQNDQTNGLVSLHDFDRAWGQAEKLSNSTLVPTDCRGRPENIILKWQRGIELGLSPMVSLEEIIVINGKTGLGSETLLALCNTRPDFEDIIETFDEASMTAKCTVKRKGRTAVTREFSKAKAELAGLWNSKDNWKKWPDRMLMHRARGYALRDCFPDCLRGVRLDDELTEIREVSASVIDASAEKLLAGDSTKVEKPEQPESPTKVEPAKQKTAPVDYDKQLAEIIGDKGNVVNAFLLSRRMISEGETWHNMTEADKKYCVENSASLIGAAEKLEAQGNV